MAQMPRETLAPAFAFAGKAFLSADSEDLSELLAELRATEAQPPLDELIRRLENSLDSETEELEKEYVRLFLNPTGAPCPPFQSMQGDDPTLMGPSHRSALAWYRAAGVEPRTQAEPADHIGLLLAFFANLIQTNTASGILDSYVEEHLAWIPAFCDRLTMETNVPFYRNLAELAKFLSETAPLTAGDPR